MSMCLLEVAQVPLEPILPLPPLDRVLHARNISRQLEALAIAEPDVVVGFTFEQLNAFGRQRGVEIGEDFLEEVW